MLPHEIHKMPPMLNTKFTTVKISHCIAVSAAINMENIDIHDYTEGVNFIKKNVHKKCYTYIIGSLRPLWVRFRSSDLVNEKTI